MKWPVATKPPHQGSKFENDGTPSSLKFLESAFIIWVRRIFQSFTSGAIKNASFFFRIVVFTNMLILDLPTMFQSSCGVHCQDFFGRSGIVLLFKYFKTFSTHIEKAEHVGDAHRKRTFEISLRDCLRWFSGCVLNFGASEVVKQNDETYLGKTYGTTLRYSQLP